MALLLFGHRRAADRAGALIYCGESGAERAAAGGAVADKYERFTAVDHPETYPFSRSRLTAPDPEEHEPDSDPEPESPPADGTAVKAPARKGK